MSELNFGVNHEKVNVEVSDSLAHGTINIMKSALLDYFFGYVSQLVKERYKECLVDLFQ